MVGVEIVDEQAQADQLGSHPADGPLARSIQQQCLRRGIVVELGGRHGSVVRFLPPLIISQEEIDVLAERFCIAVDAAIAERQTPAHSQSSTEQSALM
jgi:diaminobutyrate-2-oxoglutarate transaminase